MFILMVMFFFFFFYKEECKELSKKFSDANQAKCEALAKVEEIHSQDIVAKVIIIITTTNNSIDFVNAFQLIYYMVDYPYGKKGSFFFSSV